MKSQEGSKGDIPFLWVLKHTPATITFARDIWFQGVLRELAHYNLPTGQSRVWHKEQKFLGFDTKQKLTKEIWPKETKKTKQFVRLFGWPIFEAICLKYSPISTPKGQFKHSEPKLGKFELIFAQVPQQNRKENPGQPGFYGSKYYEVTCTVMFSSQIFVYFMKIG